MGFMGLLTDQVWEDARAKARGEPTKIFHDVRPNPDNPEIAAIYAAQKKAQTAKAPQKVEQKQAPKQAEPAPQIEGRVPTVKRKTRGTTIMAGPLAIESQGGTGTTYKKKLLGD
jgi:hypothetical protein